MRKKTKGLSYKEAGVDIDAQDEAIERLKKHVASTHGKEVLKGVGTFGTLFQPDLSGFREPVLVSSCDGVGTKLKLAFETGRHSSPAKDLVCHCANDILVQGARPLYFLDYISTSKLEPATVEEIVAGLAEGCRRTGCALIGGELAEMPGFYKEKEYDLVGFIVGIVDRDRIVTGDRIEAGDVLLGLPSAGLHTNGFSLARRIIFDVLKLGIDSELPGLGKTVADELLSPHLEYLSPLEGVLAEEGLVKGMAHITGGGLTDNLPRTLPPDCDGEIDLSAWRPLPIFDLLKKSGNVSDDEMFRTFNMGIGFVVVTSEPDARRAREKIEAAGSPVWTIGRVVEGKGRVAYVGS